ncbi:hypothetical protein DSO57_1031749 [Entomophthora muscae]|uniref:Uncharacterized protein n=1 Tax=Entomophthora muscae TaxID=34485 RepID=A0ACC2UAA0_9FUNG|nr:hypothetical protein DSO57_1031749 [Entomophthora muscae]
MNRISHKATGGGKVACSMRKCPQFNIAIRFVYVVRYIKGQHIKHPLYTARRETWLQHSSDKDEAVLSAELLSHAHTLGPKVIITESKLDQFKSFEGTFNGEVHAFVFHFRQDLLKNIKSDKKLFDKYLYYSNRKCCFSITQLTDLALLNHEHVDVGFEAIQKNAYVKKHPTIFKDYLEYFKYQ